MPGDGTEGAQATTTTTAPQPDEGSSADDENRLIWMIIAGLAAVAVIVAVLTWRYWLLTRPGLVLEGEDAEDVRRGGSGLGYGGAAARAGRVRPVAGAGTTRSGTSPGIPAGRSWGRPTPAARRAGHPRRAHRSPAARMRVPGPRVPGGAEVVPVAPVLRVAPVPRVARVARAGRVGRVARRPAVPHGRRARRAMANQSAGDGTRAPGRHRAQVGPRQPVSVVAGVSPVRAASAGSPTSGLVVPAG